MKISMQITPTTTETPKISTGGDWWRVEKASEQLEACRKVWEQQRAKEREQELREARSRLDRIETKMKGELLREERSSNTALRRHGGDGRREGNHDIHGCSPDSYGWEQPWKLLTNTQREQQGREQPEASANLNKEVCWANVTRASWQYSDSISSSNSF